MARKLRVQFPGAIYHITLRGVGRCNIFLDDRDRERFLKRLADGVELDEVRVYLFCLMTNHAHLVLETPQGNLSRFMQRVETGYSVFFNLRHGRSGHLTQGRYGAKLVAGDEYLLKLSRYLHQNPVSTTRQQKLPMKERVMRLRKYEWSSYRSYVGLAKQFDWIDYEPIRSMMRGRRARQKLEYKKFVESGLAKTDAEFMDALKASPLSLGTPEFMAKIRDLHLDLLEGHSRPEDIAFRRLIVQMEPEQVIQKTCEVLRVSEQELKQRRRSSLVRPLVARMLCKHAGLSQREVAGLIGLTTGAAVSQQLKRLERDAAKSKAVRATIKKLEASFKGKQ